MPSSSLRKRRSHDSVESRVSHHNQIGDFKENLDQRRAAKRKSSSVDDHSEATPEKRMRRQPSQAQKKELGSRPSRMYQFHADVRHSTGPAIDLTRDQVCAAPNGTSSSNGDFKPRNGVVLKGPRKLIVKNLKRPAGPTPQEYLETIWTKLDAALSEILYEKSGAYSKETLYNEVMIVCRQRQGSQLYERLKGTLQRYVNQSLKPFIEMAARGNTAKQFVDDLLVFWASWNEKIVTIRSIFYFLDRSHVLQTGLVPISELGVQHFRSVVREHERILDLALTGACEIMSEQRSGSESQSASSSSLPPLVGMFRLISSYKQHFEPRLLETSQKYYSDWSEQVIKSTDLAGYVDMSSLLMVEEKRRGQSWALEETTLRELESYMEEILIVANKPYLTAPAQVSDLMSGDRYESLTKLYSLLQRRGYGHDLCDAFESYIEEHGQAIIFDEEREGEMVSRLLAFNNKLNFLVAKPFEKDVKLGHSFRHAFEAFINKSKRTNSTWGTDNPKPGEMIAKYADEVLKGTTRAAPELAAPEDEAEQDQDVIGDVDSEITKQLDQVLNLFRFVHGKAVFEAFYKRDLARRLLLGRSASSDAEKSMLTRLKSECGSGFTHNLEQMFKDVEMAREEQSAFKSMLIERSLAPSFDLSVNVLSSSAWPSYPSVTVTMPEKILKATTTFERYYKQKHSGRKLEWKHAMAHSQIKADFAKGPKELVVSSFQAIILLCFNDAETIPYADLQALTGLDDTELQRTLQSLACAKYRVLSKNPKGRDVSKTDVFSFNGAFHHPKYRIKINQIQAKETKQENKQTHERVALDRAFETQAAIVRIMKGRKTISHAELVSEVISATKNRGPLDPVDIKKNIDKLIEKDYMERDEEGRNTYSYVA